MAWYRTGTISITTGTKAVTGVGTLWLSSGLLSGDLISFDNGAKWYEIDQITTDTALTLISNLAESTISGGAYCAIRSATNTALAGKIAAMLNSWGLGQSEFITWLSGTGTVTVHDAAGNAYSVKTPVQITTENAKELLVSITTADYTLSTLEATDCYVTVNVSGTLTGNRNLILPSTRKLFCAVKNNTSGAFTLTVKPSGGTGVTVTQGQEATLYSNGTTAEAVPTLSGAQALTGKTYNGLTVTTTTGTLTVANGKTLTANSNLTLAGVDGKTLTVNNNLTLAGTDGKTLTVSNNLTLAGTDGSTLTIGAGGTLGTAAYTASTAYAPAAGSASVITLGTVTTGTWNASVLAGQYGGTGVANTGKTITLGGNLATSGAYALTMTLTGTTNVTLPVSGTLTASADILGKQTISVPAAAMVTRVTNGPATGKAETATNKVILSTLDFDPSTAEYAQFSVRMPKAWNLGTLTATFLWSSASGTGNVVWGLQAVAISDDDVLDAAFGTAVTVTDAVTAAGDLMQSAETGAMTVAGTPAAGDWVVFQVYRDAANGSDTFAGDARLHGVALFYTTSALNDA